MPTLDEAIEILQEQVEPKPIYRNPGLLDAIRLGTEALKAIKGYRWNEETEPLCQLPGETEE